MKLVLSKSDQVAERVVVVSKRSITDNDELDEEEHFEVVYTSRGLAHRRMFTSTQAKMARRTSIEDAEDNARPVTSSERGASPTALCSLVEGAAHAYGTSVSSLLDSIRSFAPPELVDELAAYAGVQR